MSDHPPTRGDEQPIEPKSTAEHARVWARLAPSDAPANDEDHPFVCFIRWPDVPSLNPLAKHAAGMVALIDVAPHGHEPAHMAGLISFDQERAYIQPLALTPHARCDQQRHPLPPHARICGVAEHFAASAP